MKVNKINSTLHTYVFFCEKEIKESPYRLKCQKVKMERVNVDRSVNTVESTCFCFQFSSISQIFLPARLTSMARLVKPVLFVF